MQTDPVGTVAFRAERIRGLRLTGPGRLGPSTGSLAAPGEGQVAMRLTTAAICGSDLPYFGSAADPRSGRLGFPIHECVGTVVASGCTVPVGARAVAMPLEDCGLAEVLLAERGCVHVLGDALDDREATLVQPLSTVLAAIDRLGDVRGRSVAVLGLGPIGLMAAHALRHAGAGPVLGVDPLDRSGVASTFGLDGVLAAPAERWAAGRWAGLDVEVCIEAVGHSERIVGDAIHVTGHRGTILALGVPDQPCYRVPFERLFRKNLTLIASVTPDWQVWLPRAERYAVAHRPAMRRLLTDVYPILEATAAFRRAMAADPARLKVVMTAESWDR